MKNSTLRNRLEKLADKKEVNRSSMVYNWCSALKTNEKLRPVFSQGRSWKNSSLIDKTYELTSLLDKLKIKYTTGNDAPRGGKTGFFVQIDTKFTA